MRRGQVSAAFTGLMAGIAAAVVVAGTARGDQVTSKGTVLHGKITGVGSAGVTMEPEYGKGSLAIKWADIEDLKTDGNFQVLYGDGLETDTPLQGFNNGTLFVGTGIEEATQIDVTTIMSGYPIGPDGPSWTDRMRSDWRYWDGSFDLAFNFQQATTDTTGLLLGFKTSRKKDPLRLFFEADYRYSTQKQQGESSTTIQDQWYGLARAEYDLTARLYAFGSGEATYDSIQHLSIRGVPKLGLGYTFWEDKLDEDKRNFLAGEAGGAYVYQRFFGGDTNDFFAVAFALVAGYYLPYGAHWDGRADYLPAVDNWTNDYLLRGESSLTLPIIDPVSAKFSVVDVYNNRPAPDTKRNSLFIVFGLSVGW
jgi:hypothetical protein